MMDQAQNMMRNMTPEQMANMQQMMSQMSPEQMANMQRMAANMGMGGSPGVIPPGQTPYHLSGARTLKENGNTLHKAGNHADAITKYNQALQNLASQSSAEAMDLKVVCELNKAMCHLKLEEWRPCEDICSQVLQSKRSASCMLMYWLCTFSDCSSDAHVLCRRSKLESIVPTWSSTSSSSSFQVGNSGFAAGSRYVPVW